jgi:type II secretory pathway pseudopilin PulG
MGGQPPERLGRLEILGAWLGLWTPPRDAVVPPVPWRAIVVGAVVLVVVLGAAAALLLPGLAEDRQAAREREQRAEAERYAATLATADREQRPRRGRGQPDPRGAAARRTTARTDLLTRAKSDVEADARDRTGRRTRGVDCEPFPRTLDGTDPAADLTRRAAAYNCVAVTSRFDRGSPEAGEGIIGIPFRVVVHFDSGRFAWCRIVPLSDRDRLSHPLPRACRLAAPNRPAA